MTALREIKSSSPKPPKVLRAQSLELVDSEGRLRARIGPHIDRHVASPWPFPRSYRLELFDLDGEVCASVSVDDDGEGSHAFVGTKSEGPRAELRTVTQGCLPTQAEMSVMGDAYGAKGKRTISVVENGWPGYRDRGPDITYSDANVGDRYSLRIVCDEAQRHVDGIRKKAVATRDAGNRSEARRLSGEARRIAKRITRTQEQFEAREAERQAAWSKVVDSLRERRRRA